ncbi:MAG: NFACT RNA binding domain-containing protein [Erysipelotrichaceae bacterium]|nr:NFACT RNA binding domain-containing protein [Erysipelotrichaceae bacterium]
MALDGILLSKIIPEIAKALPLRIQKIWDTSSTEILFQVHGSPGKKQLLISCHSVYNRLLFSERSYPTPDEPGNFVMVLRKYLEGGFIEEITQAGLDRWCTMKIRRRNSIGDLENWNLYIELMGKYANVILVSSEGKIIDAMKRIPPFENSRRTVFPGAQFVPTEPQNKKDPFTEQSVDPDVTLTKQFAGFSPFLSKEVEYRMANGESFSAIMEEIRNSDSLFVANNGSSEPVFHCIELKSKGECRQYPLFEGFDILYYHREEKERIRTISGDIFKFVSRSLKHQETKLPRLLSELDEALECDQYRTYGELLYAYNITDTKGRTEITLKSFEDDSDIRIPLDPRLDGKANARKAFQKYNKLKKGQVYLSEQIEITENEIAYFKGLLEQLEQADFNTAAEIRTELINLGYLKETKKKPKKKGKKKETPVHIVSVTLPTGTMVSFGRNNLQNEALTWNTARKNEIWLHAKDYHGSHVVIHDSEPDEETLRTAANIAAYYSAGRMSSSVPVIWCPVRNLKKIPGAKPGMVQLGSYRTIYIDPDENLIHSLDLS